MLDHGIGRRIRMLGLVSCVIVAWTVMPLSGQDPSETEEGKTTPVELRQEIDRLSAQVADLQAQLADAERLLNELQVENERLREQLVRASQPVAGAGAGGSPPLAESTSGPPIDPTIFGAPGPLSSPDALLAALSADYASVLSPPEAFDSEMAFNGFLREVTAWSKLKEPEHDRFRGPVNWVCVLEWITPTDAGTELRLLVLDPRTGEPFSHRRFDVVVSERIAEQIRERPGQDVWLLSGYLEANPRVSRDRHEAGYFDDPPFIGPYAELTFDLDVIEFGAILPGEGASEPASP